MAVEEVLPTLYTRCPQVPTSRDDFELSDEINQSLTFTLEMVFLRNQRQVSIYYSFNRLIPGFLCPIRLGSCICPTINRKAGLCHFQLVTLISHMPPSLTVARILHSLSTHSKVSR